MLNDIESYFEQTYGMHLIYTKVNTGAIASVCTHFLNYINN